MNIYEVFLNKIKEKHPKCTSLEELNQNISLSYNNSIDDIKMILSYLESSRYITYSLPDINDIQLTKYGLSYIKAVIKSEKRENSKFTKIYNKIKNNNFIKWITPYIIGIISGLIIAYLSKVWFDN